MSEPSAKESDPVPDGDNQEEYVPRPILLPAAAPSRGGDDDVQDVKKTKKLRLAEASSPSSSVGYRKDNDNEKTSKIMTTKLRLAEGAAGSVGVRTSHTPTDGPSSLSTKKDIANRIRLASGHYQEEEQDEPSRPSIVSEPSSERPESDHDDDGELVEAEQVQDVEELLDERIQNMPVAIASEENHTPVTEKKPSTTRRIFLVLFVLAVVGSIAAGVFLLTSENDDDSTATTEPSSSSFIPTVRPTVAPEPTSSPTSFQSWIKGVLEPYVDDTTPWDDPSSVQYEALEWMERDKESWLPGNLLENDDGVDAKLFERYALLAIVLHFSGEFERAAFSQFTHLPSCDWKIDFFGIIRGFDCGDGRWITQFSWNDMAANNTIPTEVGLLSNLQVFEINNNVLFGTIPPALFRLSSLNTVGLANNRLSGTLPSEVSASSVLEVLDLRGNSLSGTIPSSYGEMTSIRNLYLQGNAALSGVLPTSFANLRELTDLRLSGTSLVGGMEEIICGTNDTNSAAPWLRFENLVADCAGSQPKVECSCCTSCCGNGMQLQDDKCSI